MRISQRVSGASKFFYNAPDNGLVRDRYTPPLSFLAPVIFYSFEFSASVTALL